VSGIHSPAVVGSLLKGPPLSAAKNEATSRIGRSASPRPPPPCTLVKPSAKIEVTTRVTEEIPGPIQPAPYSQFKVQPSARSEATSCSTNGLAAAHPVDVPPPSRCHPAIPHGYTALFQTVTPTNKNENTITPSNRTCGGVPPPPMRGKSGNVQKSRDESLYSSLVDLQSLDALKCATLHARKDDRMYSSSESLLSDGAKCTRRRLAASRGRNDGICPVPGKGTDKYAAFVTVPKSMSKSDDDDDDAYQCSSTYYSMWHGRPNAAM